MVLAAAFDLLLAVVFGLQLAVQADLLLNKQLALHSNLASSSACKMLLFVMVEEVDNFELDHLDYRMLILYLSRSNLLALHFPCKCIRY